MSRRVAHRLATEASTTTCARCLDAVHVDAGTWHPAERNNPTRPVCDRCAQRDDPDGFAMTVAFRRMSKPIVRGAA